MTVIELSPGELEKWMTQNNAEYAGPFLEGCLLDNFMLCCKHGYAAVYEKPVGSWLCPGVSWSSRYRIEFERGAAPKVWANWHKFWDAYVAEYGDPDEDG